jgi:hypothetical protein
MIAFNHYVGLKSIFMSFVGLTFCFLFSSCEDDDAPAAENEVEVITRATLTFTPVLGGTTVVTVANDVDGLGPGNFVQESIPVLESSTVYDLFISVEDARDPADIENITEEVEEEANEHQFYFFVTNNVFLEDPLAPPGSVYRDFDVNFLPLGLDTRWTSNPSGGTGTFRVVLKHQPGEKNQATASDRMLGVATGDTDFDFTFDIAVN